MQAARCAVEGRRRGSCPIVSPRPGSCIASDPWRGLMIPFSPLMYPDDVVFFRSVPATGAQGASHRTFPGPGIPLKASVQSKSVDRTDRDGRVATVTLHVV